MALAASWRSRKEKEVVTIRKQYKASAKISVD
jgi:hypothetical protein